MICTCQSCHTPFWRYRRDWPPKGFCSQPCFEVGPRAACADEPPLPAVALGNMMHHRRFFHESNSPLGWFDCRMCEELEADYAAALEYHYREITTDIAAEADHRWAAQVSAAKGATS